MSETKGPFEPRTCKDVPADCCDFAVISLSEGVEICRVWKEADARKISDLLNATALERLSGRVRPLEWKEPTPGRYIAKAPFNLGQYVVDRHPGGNLIVWIAPGPDEDWQIASTLEDAFAAAQADTTARALILAILEALIAKEDEGHE